MINYKEVRILNRPKYFCKLIFIRPINILLLPILAILRFIDWMITSDEDWDLGERFLNMRLSPTKEDIKLWWDLKSSCISKYYVRY